MGAQVARRPARAQARAPQDLVGQQVADTGDRALVERPRLQRRRAAADARAELLPPGRRPCVKGDLQAVAQMRAWTDRARGL